MLKHVKDNYYKKELKYNIGDIVVLQNLEGLSNLYKNDIYELSGKVAVVAGIEKDFLYEYTLDISNKFRFSEDQLRYPNKKDLKLNYLLELISNNVEKLNIINTSDFIRFLFYKSNRNIIFLKLLEKITKE